MYSAAENACDEQEWLVSQRLHSAVLIYIDICYINPITGDHAKQAIRNIEEPSMVQLHFDLSLSSLHS